MSNLCRYTISAAGPDDELRAAVDLLASADREIHKDSDCGDVILRVTDFVADESDEAAWWGLYLRDEDDLGSWYELGAGRLELRGGRNWSPPLSVVQSLSRRFLGLTWECDFQIEFHHRKIVSYRAGQEFVRLHEAPIGDLLAVTLVTIREGCSLDPPVLRITYDAGQIDSGARMESKRLELEIPLRPSTSWHDAGQLLQAATRRVAWGLSRSTDFF